MIMMLTIMLKSKDMLATVIEGGLGLSPCVEAVATG